MTIKKTLIKTDELKYYENHLYIINSVLPVKLTNKEIEILSNIMNMKGDVNNNVLGSAMRAILKDKLGLSSSSLSSYIKQLTSKGFISVINNKIEILKLLIPDNDEQEYNFKLINNGKKN